MQDSFALIYLPYRSKRRLGQGHDARDGTMDRHQGEMFSTLTDLLSKHRAGRETGPGKDYLMSSVIGNIPHQESSQLLRAPMAVLASHIQGKDTASWPTSLFRKSLLCKTPCFRTLQNIVL